jgi:pyruvate/2-oxoglutarate dehydrogenase complex dihydrolipoamide acyltransferase (E2) component
MAERLVQLPRLGEAMAEATVVAWLVEAGEQVIVDQPLVEVETDKSVQEVVSPCAGVVTELRAETGERYQVDDVLAVVEDDREASSEIAKALAAAPEPLASDPGGAVGPAAPLPRSADRFLSPRVRRLLDLHELSVADLDLVTPTGLDGRVTAADVERLVARLDADYESQPLPSLRGAVAEGMTRSWRRPLATMACGVRLEAVLAHRRTVSGRPSLSVYALHALATALRERPQVATLIAGGRIQVPKRMRIALAVAVDGGIRMPVIEDADQKSYADLEAEVAASTEEARHGKGPGWTGAIAAVSNYGSLGLDWATPVPAAGQNCILGVGAPRRQPVWNARAKQFEPIRACELTLTIDHRVSDGADAANLLHKVIALLEHPVGG